MTDDARPVASPIEWDHPSRLIGRFVVQSTVPVETVRTHLQTAVSEHRMWVAHGRNALTDLRLDGEVGVFSFDLTATPYLMRHVRARSPKVHVQGDLRKTTQGCELHVSVVCSPRIGASEQNAQSAADVRQFLIEIISGPSPEAGLT